MKTLIALLTLAFAGSAFAQMTQEDLGRQYDRDQQMDTINMRNDDLERQFRQYRH